MSQYVQSAMSQNSFKLKPHMCKQQKDELKQLLVAADEIGAAATSVSSQGGQGYEKLVEARDNFKKLLLSTAEHYRIVETIEEEPDIKFDL